jgi:hypothetical protein
VIVATGNGHFMALRGGKGTPEDLWTIKSLDNDRNTALYQNPRSGWAGQKLTRGGAPPRVISSTSGLLNAALAIKANQGGFGSLRSYVISYR